MPPGQHEQQGEEGDEQRATVARRQPVGVPEPPRVDEQHRPQGGEGQQHDLQHEQRPAVGEHGEGGGAAHQGEEPDEHRGDEEAQPDPQGEPPELPVAGGQLGGAGRDDGEAEEGHRPAPVTPGVARGAGVDTDRRLGLLALEHRGAALRSHGC